MGTSLETLLMQERWDDVRNKLQRFKYTGPKARYVNLLCAAEDIPNDILEILISKRFPLVDKGDTECCLHDSRSFRNGCQIWSLEYLERFLQTVVRVTELQTDAPRFTIVTLRNNFSASIYEESILQVSSIEDLRSNDKLHRLYDLWQRIELLMRAFIPDGFVKPMEELPFLCRMIENKIPKVLLWLALKLYPKQVAAEDEKGRLPLHWAARFNNDESESIHIVVLPEPAQAEVDMSLVDLFMKAYPEGAAHADSEGSYPLDVLLDTEFRGWHLSDWTHGDVMNLARYAPAALTRPSKLNQLLPFMAANCRHKSAGQVVINRQERQTMALRKLNLTFSLLMQNPNAVISGITSTEREIWLTDKLDKAQSHIQVVEAENAKLRKMLHLPIEKSGPPFPLYKVGDQPLSTAMPPRKRKRTTEARKDAAL